jgi:hypothetical protein
MGDEIPHNNPCDHNTPQKEKRRIQNKLNERRYWKRLKLAVPGSCKMAVIFTTPLLLC